MLLVGGAGHHLGAKRSQIVGVGSMFGYRTVIMESRTGNG